MAGTVDTKHPDYVQRLPNWEMMRDTVMGENGVKDRLESYLPIPDGFYAQPDNGRQMYSAYITRAQFPEIVRPTIAGMVGVIHRTEADIKLPKAMEGLTELATPDGLPLEDLHKRITGELLTTGRVGLLPDLPEEGGDLPLIATYRTEDIINWEPRSLDFFVLDESQQVRDGYGWRLAKKWRVLDLVDGKYRVQQVRDNVIPNNTVPSPTIQGVDPGRGGALAPPKEVTGPPQGGLVTEAERALNSDAPTEVFPTKRGGGNLDFVPFVMAGPRGVNGSLEDSPLIGVARAALAIYRLDADYRHQLYMSGQETLFILGIQDNTQLPTHVGAGVIIGLQSGGAVGSIPDAKYVSPSCSGIEAHRIAMDKEREHAAASGAQLMAVDDSKAAESGEALKLRFASQTASLVDIALASAKALEKALKYAAMMIGANPDEVIVTPNLQFIDTRMTPADAVSLVTVWQQGAIAKQTLYENLQRGEIASAERTFDDEEELINNEMPAGDAPVIGGPDPAEDPTHPSNDPALIQQDHLAQQDALLAKTAGAGGSPRFVDGGSGLRKA
jgi:hypothetical protein